MAGSIQIRLYNTDDIPILEKGSDSVESVVRWRAEMAAWALERGLMPYIVGPLPGGATAREQLEGLQYSLVSLVKDPDPLGSGGRLRHPVQCTCVFIESRICVVYSE